MSIKDDSHASRLHLFAQFKSLVMKWQKDELQSIENLNAQKFEFYNNFLCNIYVPLLILKRKKIIAKRLS